MTVLSLNYHLGPKVYGTFLNGRIEQFFPSRALSPQELRDPGVSVCIAKRMRELHSVDLKLLGFDADQPMIWRLLKEWAELAEEIVPKLAAINDEWKKYVGEFHLEEFRQQMEDYRQYLQQKKSVKVVFAREWESVTGALCSRFGRQRLSARQHFEIGQ